jgi:hypothetical protein
LVPVGPVVSEKTLTKTTSKNSLHNLQHDEGGNYMAEAEAEVCPSIYDFYLSLWYLLYNEIIIFQGT